MIVYSGIKRDFQRHIINNEIVDIIEKEVKDKLKRSTPKSELRSWANSLKYMFIILEDQEIPFDAGVAIEYKIPNTSKRVDFIITGENNSGEKNVIIIELKQWEKVEIVSGQDGVINTFLGQGLRNVAHPSYQAWSYASLIRDFNSTVQNENINLFPCAYLHNYKKRPIEPLLDESFHKYIEEAPLFLDGDALKLRHFIKKFITRGNATILYDIEHGKLRPSKSLQDAITSMVEGNTEFILIDEQKVIFEKLFWHVINNDKKKKVFIIDGGPGTGKSVLAINLLSEITKKELVSFYVSKNSAPRNVFLKKLTDGNFKKAQVNILFTNSGKFIDVPSNTFDCLIVDEAHRLNEKSGLFANQGENQIKEIINASRMSVFFIDDKQRVTLKDIGSVSEIKKWARYLNAEIFYDQLESQFRCNGSDGYLAWIDNLLQIEDTANNNFDFDYDFRVFDNPTDLYEEIRSKNSNNKSRMLAGYCWNWNTESRSKSDYHDIVISKYNFSLAWNLDNTATWAIDPNSINQVGCIHTSQGLEFEYVGVIIGDDLRYDDGKIITDFTKRAQTDQSLKGIKTLYKKDKIKAITLAEEIIKNTYRTLMTRGSKGCYVYCTDEKLNNYIKKLLLQK